MSREYTDGESLISATGGRQYTSGANLASEVESTGTLITDSLVAVWELNEASGNALDAFASETLTDNGTVGATTGVIAGCRTFNGTSQYFSRADDAPLSREGKAWSMTAWVYSTDGSSYNVCSKYSSFPNFEFEIAKHFNGSGNFLSLRIFDSGGSSDSVYATAYGDLPTATWIFVFVSFDPTPKTAQISINAGTINSNTGTRVISAGSAPFELGRVEQTDYLSGRLDQVALWDRVLTQTEIATVYNNGAGLAYPWSGSSPPPAISPSGSVTPTGTLVLKTTKGLAGSTTPSGTLTRQTNKPLAGSVSATGTLTKLTAKPLAGSTTLVGALAKLTTKPLAGSVTAAGALTKQANKAVSGSVTPTGAITKAVAKPLAGSSTPAGALAKQARKPFAGSSTASGTLTTTKVVVLGVSGSVTASGILVRSINKGLSGSVPASGALAKSISKPVAGSVTVTGALARQVAKPFSGSAAASGTLTRAVHKVVAGSLVATGALSRAIRKALAGSVRARGTLTLSGGGGGSRIFVRRSNTRPGTRLGSRQSARP